MQPPEINYPQGPFLWTEPQTEKLASVIDINTIDTRLTMMSSHPDLIVQESSSYRPGPTDLQDSKTQSEALVSLCTLSLVLCVGVQASIILVAFRLQKWSHTLVGFNVLYTHLPQLQRRNPE